MFLDRPTRSSLDCCPSSRCLFTETQVSLSDLWSSWPMRSCLLRLELNCPPPFLPTENDASPEVVAQLAQEMYMHDVLLLLVERIGVFEFEVRPPQPKSTCATPPADQALSLFPFAGKEGRHADLQPPSSPSDRLQVPYGRVHHKEASGRLCYAQGVSRLLTARGSRIRTRLTLALPLLSQVRE